MPHSPEKIAQLLHMRIIEHKTLTEIEKEAHVDKKTVVKYTSEAWNKERDRLIKEVTHMRERRSTIEDVMAATGLSRATVVRYSREGFEAEVRKLRNEQGMSIQEVMDVTGLSRDTVIRYSRLEDGARRSTHWKQERHVIYDTTKTTAPPEDDEQEDDFEWTPEELAEALRLAREGNIETED